MTKTKKKMSKSTFAIIIMAVAMVAMLAFGGTFAYFTAEANDATGTTTVGTVEISTGASATIAEATDFAVPGSTIYENQSVKLTNTSTVDIYVFAKLSAQIDGKDLFVRTGTDPTYTYASAISAELGSAVTAERWEAVTGHDGVYGYLVESNKTPTAIANFVFTVTLNKNIEEHHNEDGFDSNNIYTDKAGTAYNQALEGKTITVTVTFDAIQAETFDDIQAAYAALIA